MSKVADHNPASDIIPESWIMRATPKAVRPYMMLMRLDRPNGSWLLMMPCWWSITLAAENTWPDLTLLGLFGLGAFIMRGAGCVINDIADRDFDGQVARTANRPIPSGLVSVRNAVLFAGLLCLFGLAILVQLNLFAIGIGILSLVTVLIYPYMKRFTYWPQLFLGIAINWGALLGWAAVRGELGLVPGLLYLGGVFWTLGYDTMYGHQDKEDDIRVGIKSAALRLGDATPAWMVFFYVTAVVLIGAAGWFAGLNVYFYPALLIASLHLVWQVVTLDIHNPKNCLKRFSSNRDYGFLVFLAVLIGHVF
ncbi:MAG: 4-hydroxybenzoate octaprenyltransferase [Rhodospirillaceae bacterium]|nr:MAG: 4-hydroxybenzoate octaprenyltransferase [Rhodospirillaceae bacterium]